MTRTQAPTAPLEFARRIDWNAVSTWLLGFGLVAYLGLKGGGYDPLVHDQVGIAVWWVLLATVLVGALPRRRLGPLAWAGLSLFAGFVTWTALSLIWTESVERTSADLARVVGYLGIFALALLVRDSRGARRMVAAVGTGIAFIAIVGLLSRLHPTWFPEGRQTAHFLWGGKERLSYPLDYWNALAALVAIGLPLLLQVATCARTVLVRTLAAAAMPALELTAFLTLSRGGTAATIIALGAFLALTSDRLPKLLTLLVAGTGGAILIAAATQREALQQGLLNAIAQHQGNEMLAMTLVVCAGAGLVQAGISVALTYGTRPRWTRISRRQSLGALLASALAVTGAAVVLSVPSRTSNAWSEFKHQGSSPAGISHLSSAAGEGRYQLWASAVQEDLSKPLTGTGSGTFVYWWARKGKIPLAIQDTHSLYLQTFGELGIIGLALLVIFLLAVLTGGTLAILRSGRRRRSQLAAAVAGCLAFCTAAIFDWVWQIPVLPVAFLLLASTLVTVAHRRHTEHTTLGLPVPQRIIFVPAAIAAMVAIAIPLTSTMLIRKSQSDARAGEFPAALSAALTAQNVQPGAATPRLQQALVLESQGSLVSAAAAGRAATRREPTNWHTWLVLSRIEAERGLAPAALRAYRKARSLNPHSPLFSETS